MKKIIFPFILILSFVVLNSALALFYDFEDKNQLKDWDVLGEAKWEVEDGVLVCDEPAGTRQQQRLELKDVVFTDGTIEFKLKWLSGTYLEGGVFYRLQDDNNWYNTHLSNVEQSDRWMAYVNGVLDWTPVNLAKGLAKETWYELKLEASGKSHKVWVDGELLHEKKHDQFKQGKVAIGTWSAVVENWHLDDFRINGPGISPDAVNRQGKLTTTWGKIKSHSAGVAVSNFPQ